MNVLRCMLIMVFLLLFACHSSTEEHTPRLKNEGQAAQYNMQLGLAYLQEGDLIKAKKKLIYALDLSPNAPEVNTAMAYFLERTAESEQANHYYKKAVALAPSGSQFNNYGSFLCRQGKYQEADKYFLKAVADFRYEKTAAAYENAGLCAAAVPKYKKAKQYFIKALDHDPLRRASLYNLVSLELKQGYPKEVLRHLALYSALALNDKDILVIGVTAAKITKDQKLQFYYQKQQYKLNQFIDDTGATK